MMAANARPLPPPEPETEPGRQPTARWRLDLLKRFPRLKWLVRRRWFQFALILPNLLLFTVFLLAGIFGSPVGNRNIIIIWVWILWWFLLISVMVPFASRVWCAMCPFPFFGEWFQRRSLVRAVAIDPKTRKKTDPGVTIGRNRYFGWNLRWPKKLSNIWIQNIAFLALCSFSALFLTRPLVSVIVLGAIFSLATVLHLVYRQRAFCNYICPVSGFLSLYAMTSMVEVRRRDYDVCLKCRDKGCLAGSDRGWGCPWFMYPSKMERNNYCGLCMECIKTCPHDNMTVNLRGFCADTKLKGYDEAWKAFIMLGIALAYSVTYLGPWGFLKDWANVAESGAWAGFAVYASSLWLLALVLLPAVFYLAVQAGRRLAQGAAASNKEIFLRLVYPVVPLGLMVWVAFSFPLILANGSYILMTLSDPLGWGWDLFGTGHLPWTPVAAHWTPHVQVLFLALGLYWALKTGHKEANGLFADGRQAVLAFAPMSVLLTGTVLCFLWLYVA